MSLDKKIISEIERYRSINQYIMEQAAVPPPPGEDPLGALAPEAGATPPPAPAAAVPPAAPAEPEIIDVENDPDVEKIDDEGKSEEGDGGEGSEELDITELVDSQKNIEKKQEDYFNNLFNQLNDLQSKLGEMDNIMNKLNSLENKIEKYREKTPQEKLELIKHRSDNLNKIYKRYPTVPFFI